MAAAAESAASAGTIRPEEVVSDVESQDKLLLWEKMWGSPHLHHGFYDPGVTAPSLAESRAAFVRMIEEALRFAGVSDDPEKRPKRILDVGCGVGGASLYLAKKYGAHCDGINIMPLQVERARAHAAAEGLEDQVTFHLGDALQQPFPDGQFDLVWCMESAEHMTDKEKLLGELVRLAAPGATIVIAAMCERGSYEKPFTPDQEIILKQLLEWVQQHRALLFTVSGYVKIAESFSVKDIKTADWTENVLPFWPAVAQIMTTLEGSTMLLKSSTELIKTVLMAPTMAECLKKKHPSNLKLPHHLFLEQPDHSLRMMSPRILGKFNSPPLLLLLPAIDPCHVVLVTSSSSLRSIELYIYTCNCSKLPTRL